MIYGILPTLYNLFMLIEILIAKLTDIPSVHQLFVRCTDALLAAGIKQWHYDYPGETHIRKDVEAGETYVIREGKECLATITLNGQQDEQYQAINWKYAGEKVLVIHRLAVHPKAQGRGLAKALCSFAAAFAKKQQYNCIRLDAYAGNPGSNALYEKLGYDKAEGLCHFHGNEFPFYCWELRI
ncbi:MAG: GNAT superfamily N-acetyltransferase [Polaribacter sp.]